MEKKRLKQKSENDLVKLSILFTLFNHRIIRKTLRGSKWPTIAGIAILVLGITFHLQGQSIIGPPTSFMYSNPEWVDYGMQIAIIGVGIIAIGIGMKFFKKTS